MTAKEFLKQYENADRRAKRLRAEYEMELEMIDAVRSLSNNDGMPHGSGTSKPTEEKAVRLADKRLEYLDKEIDAIRIRQKVFDVVNAIDGVEGDLLMERYVNLKKWEEICVELHYSWRGVHKVHGRALRLVEEYIEVHYIDVV